MTIETAIKKATEGGWKPKGMVRYFSNGKNFISNKVQAAMKVKYKERFYLDPQFWQCLGKSMGWDTYSLGRCILCGGKPDDSDRCSTCKISDEHAVPEWFYQSHTFWEHIMNGESIESYFGTL